ncbi:MAG: polyphosphate kinase 2 family protein [Gemmatimonadetes bacterium]|nr:polyphosphate kinase 2 family protein [Gemmatimonadota bacterium]MBT8479368.1 polyphosphate kinase 2 family protein [Gemmatimonadota bacterium]NNK48789.1 polyphosphate kinase 2 family protein [Gemmatimonadota bacterium]
MFKAVSSSYLVPFDGTFQVAGFPTAPPDSGPTGKAAKQALRRQIEELDDLQRMLAAQDRYSVLLVFQAMDAAGKDGTIRAVMRGINPAGVQVFSFKRPSALELDHDFLWRSAVRLPERGRIGIFNRSYYEEVLVVRVHPGILMGQRLPYPVDPESIWTERFESIRDHEKHLARNGTVILKFWLNVSRNEQKRRFLDRIDEPEKNWKFNAGDVDEREHWNSYMKAYEEALNATSRPWAPWYSIPADDKRFMRLSVSEIVCRTLSSLALAYPEVGEQTRRELLEARDRLITD